MEAHLNELFRESDPSQCPDCKAPFVGVEQLPWLSKPVCPYCSPIVSTSLSLTLAKHYLPRVWPGLVLALPALLVLPAYDRSLWFHIWMNASWIYWVCCIYKLHYTLKKSNQSYEIQPLRTSVITAAMGSHPFNYLLELFAATLAFFPGTASGLMIVPAVPLLFILGFWWYRRMFNQICRFVAEQLPEPRALMNPGSLIALSLLTPGALQLLLRATGFSLDTAIWVSEALFPIGMAVAFCLLISFRNSIALLLANDAEFPKLTKGSSKEIGIMPSADRLETTS